VGGKQGVSGREQGNGGKQIREKENARMMMKAVMTRCYIPHKETLTAYSVEINVYPCHPRDEIPQPTHG